jgi:diaminohydroxyphosphoribosylaminopyrimidine deaminase / 5-amino-6-(5-phosphoribosylamino)uracil reductase
MRTASSRPWWPHRPGSEVDAADRALLERCLELAERGARTAAPNPMVGCVLARDGVVIAEGWHERPGAPHAEINALRAAGDARGATAYVSLEPCAHHGRTPPCADALIEAGVTRVMVAAGDPDPRTNGQGLNRLSAASVEVEVAPRDLDLARRARLQNAAFRTLIRYGRPHVTYKAAVSLDGRTATASGESRWISSPESRRLVHEWRARSAAVAVGVGTAIADDPMLTARDCDPPAERQPVRVVFDRRGRLPLDSSLVTSAADVPLVVVTEPGAPGGDALRRAGADVIAAAEPAAALAELGRRELSSLLVEGGATLAGALLADELIDRLALFVAPIVLGEGGPGIVAGWVAPGLDHARRATLVTDRRVGPDTLLIAELNEN